jgi:hypothetical protein
MLLSSRLKFFPVTVQTGGVNAGPAHFFVVPPITPQDVTVTGGTETLGVDVPVQDMTPPLLSLLAVGFVDTAGSTGVSLPRGNSVELFLVGGEVVPGTFYLFSGSPGDIALTQPVVAGFAETTDGTPAVNLQIFVSPSAVVGPRDILVRNPAGEISAFVGGLLITE